MVFLRENKSGKMYQANSGSKSNNFETNTSTKDLVLAETAFLSSKKTEEIEPSDEEIKINSRSKSAKLRIVERI